MRALVLGASILVLASCTLLVPIDDDLTAAAGPDGGTHDTGVIETSTDAAPETAAPDSGEPFGPAREGCPNGVALDPELEGYYPFDETEGSVLHDCSRKARDLASLSAAVPKWTDGHLHGAADFNGVDGCFGADDSSWDRFEGSSFTVSVWVLARQYEEPSHMGRWIIGHKISPHGWHVGADDPDRLELDLEWVETTDRKTEISSVFELNSWVHFATTYSEKGEAAVYRNGVLTEKQSGPSVPGMFGTDATVFLRVGCRAAASGVWDGKIDELRIYSRVLTEEKIRELAQAR